MALIPIAICGMMVIHHSWAKFNDDCLGSNAIPNTVVKELEVNLAINKIRAGTFGRSMWESDLACPDNIDLTLSGTISTDDWKEAQENIYSTQELISGKVNNRAGVSIQLEPGFVADPLTNINLEYYKAFIHACIGPNNSSIPFRQAEFISINEFIEQEEKNSQKQWVLNVRPNPASTSLEIGIGITDTFTIKIYDLLGNLVYKHDIVGSPTVLVDISKWNNGLLIIEVNHHGIIKREKVLKL